MGKKKVIKSKTVHYDVDDIKALLEFAHSEEVFEIESEIPHQCPRIDSFIEDVELLKKHFKRLEDLFKENDDNVNKDYIYRELSVIEEYLKLFESTYEELRIACDKLRSRGTGWKTLARNLFDKLDDNRSFIPEKILKKLK